METFQSRYRPKRFEDLIFPDCQTRQRLLEFALNKRHESLIFHGPFGTAKTTTAIILVQQRSSELEFGGVDFHRACDVGNGSFTGIANTHAMQRLAGVQLPVSIIDEVDKLHSDLQYKFRWELDTRRDQGSFIFTTNKLHEVDAGLRDRCDVIEMPKANTPHWLERAKWILKQEGIRIPDSKLEEVLRTCDGSIRDLMRSLEDVILRRPRLVA